MQRIHQSMAGLAGMLVLAFSLSIGLTVGQAQEPTGVEVTTVAVEETAEVVEPPPYKTLEELQALPILYPKFMIDNLWVLIAAGLVFIMHAGFSTVESGLCRSKNTVNVLTKNLFIVSAGILTYAFCGFSLMYPGDAWIIPNVLGFGGIGIGYSPAITDAETVFSKLTPAGYELDMTTWTDFIFQAMFAATAATIVSGAVAERIKLSAFMVFATILVAILYPITGSWKWAGAGSISWDSMILPDPRSFMLLVEWPRWPAF